MTIDFNAYVEGNCLNFKGKKAILFKILSNEKNLNEFSSFIQNNSHITALNLESCNLVYKDIKLLISYITVNTTIATLNLGYNNIGDAGAKVIVGALLVNITIANLDLRSNRLSDAGVEAIANALKLNKTLANLNMACNEISTEGIKPIVIAKAYNLTSASIDLGINIDVEVKKMQLNKEKNDSRVYLIKSFKAIISKITLDTDGTPLLSSDAEGGEQNSFLNTLKNYSEKHGAFSFPILEDIIAQSLYQNTVHVYKNGTEQLSFAARSDALTKVTQIILECLGLKEDKIDEFNSKIVGIIEEVKEMFLLELDISNNNMARTWKINTKTEEFDSTSSLPFLFYHEFTVGDTWLPFPNMNVELLDVLQKADESQKVELKNNQQLASLYKQFPDLKTPGIILQKTLEDAINGSPIGDIEILLKEKQYEQIFKHNSLIQELLNDFIELNNISAIELQESSLAPKQKVSLEAPLAQHSDSHLPNISEHTSIDLATDDPITPVLGDSSHHITD
ncbi:MAG TPA: hypothetical protein LFW13_00590 [Rickettsia endosymbiont of Sericostoma sp.]|nr:hypothetical protein [Rickettsia endosymbiont of Sericostoma sp.]